jgi:hypothetical protein
LSFQRHIQYLSSNDEELKKTGTKRVKIDITIIKADDLTSITLFAPMQTQGVAKTD